MLKDQKQIMKNWKNFDKPLVSISCVTYNHQDYIENTIKSFLIQETDFCFEILITDDASTDKTVKIIKRYVDQYPDIIKPLFHQTNQFRKSSQPHIANITRAQGEYIAFCDGDDFWSSHKKLSKQIAAMKEYNDCNVSFHGVKIHNLLTNEISEKCPSKKILIYEPWKIIFFGNKLYTSTVSIIIKKKIFFNSPYFYLNAPTEDYYILILGSLKNGALFIPDVMSVYRLFTPDSWHFDPNLSKHFYENFKCLFRFLLSLKIVQIYLFPVVIVKLIEFRIKSFILKFFYK